ncbi:MAG: hypothetical protein R3223_03840, partial [Longimicrobiales bacterium]|nr:hypothetical protein [Longimicrobiales bacterium]
MTVDPCEVGSRRSEPFRCADKEGDGPTRRRTGNRKRAGKRILRLSAALGLAALLGGCGNLTAGGVTGETTVYVVGNGEDAAAATSASAEGSAAEGPLTRESIRGGSWVAAAPLGATSDDSEADDGDDSDDEPEGEMEMHFFLSLVRPDGTTEPLTDDEAQIKIDLPGRQEVEVLTRRVPSGRYDGFRVTFTDIEVEVDAGLIIGGVEVVGP